MAWWSSSGNSRGMQSNDWGSIGKYAKLTTDDGNFEADPFNVDPNQRREKDAKKKKLEDDRRNKELYGKMQPLNASMDSADSVYANKYGSLSENYLSSMGKNKDDYLRQSSFLADESKKMASDAKATYSNDIQPRMKNIMEDAQKEAASAMSLKDAMDPNNSVMKGVRELYDQRAKGAKTQGMQDFGVMSALGAQAAQGQFGAMPMTSGMMGQIYSQNQRQASEAVARASQRARDLEDQGMERSFDQSNRMYEYGVGARDRYSKTVGDYEASNKAYQDQMKGYRDEQSGYASDRFGVQSGYDRDVFDTRMGGADIDREKAYNKGTRDLNALYSYYGMDQQAANNLLAAQNAANTSKVNTAGTVAGSVTKSDRRSKTNISSVSDKELDEFLSKVKPKMYDYKEPETSGTLGGKRVGFMLQDVQDTKLGKAITRKAPDGSLMYDKDNLNSIILAGLARDQQRRKA